MAVKDRIPLPEQSPELRRKNFDEVAIGYTLELAQEEAKRCLQCKVPTCISGCPVGIDIPRFIKELVNENLEKSFRILKSYNYLPSICGRVCPQENQCEGSCLLNKLGKPVNIGALERFVADWAAANNVEENKEETERNNKISASLVNNKSNKIAIIGTGPSGLTAASELGKIGFTVHMYEALHEPGGVLVYGIPEFRLPKDVV
ncbi:MAG TPA: NAD(P)-binding protein, partial [Fervidobacterium sp.]|nr:NAD(P)-binding protein [Fervidobacterium sp.]